MPIEYGTGKFISYPKHIRKAMVNILRSYENNFNSVLNEYTQDRVMIYLGADKRAPHTPSIMVLADTENWEWLSTAGATGGPQKLLTVGLQIVPQVALISPEQAEDAIQDFVAVIISVLEANLQFNVTITDNILAADSPLAIGVWDSWILNGTNIEYKYRMSGALRAANIKWQGKVDYLSPLLTSAASFSSSVTQADLEV